MIVSIFLALLLDILAFTVILPLFPRLMDYYQSEYEKGNDHVYGLAIQSIAKFRELVGSNESKFDIVLVGGALGSLFAFLQFLASPVIGRLSDKYGRKRTLLWTMVGNILSAGFWIFSKRFGYFVLARVIGGLSEGNVQISVAMITDLTTQETRSKGLALVGIAFALGFTFGPFIGAYFASVDLAKVFPSLASMANINSFSAVALLCTVLLTVETLYIMLAIPETIGFRRKSGDYNDPEKSPTEEQSVEKQKTKSFIPLMFAHAAYLFFFSGMEFTLTFLTFYRFNFSNMQQGMMLGIVGILSSLFQGGYVRRYAYKIGEKKLALQGFVACFTCAIALGIVGTKYDPFYSPNTVYNSTMWAAIVGFAFASASVVNGLTSLYSVLSDDGKEKQGESMGYFRSSGQLGRALGPIFACSIYWSVGSVTNYLICGAGIALVGIVVYMFVDERKLVEKTSKQK